MHQIIRGGPGPPWTDDPCSVSPIYWSGSAVFFVSIIIWVETMGQGHLDYSINYTSKTPGLLIKPQTYHHSCLLLSDIDSNVVRSPPPLRDNLDSDCHLWYLTLVCCVNNIDILTLVSVGKIPHFLSHDFLTFILFKISNKLGRLKVIALKFK